MKKRKIELADGTPMVLNDNDWQECVINRKEFDTTNTEILRVTKHTSGLLTRVYAMRSVDGKKVAETNEMVVGDNLPEVLLKAIAACGLTRITAESLL